jgi:hypothetical protein
MRRLLRSARWGAGAVRDDIRGCGASHRAGVPDQTQFATKPTPAGQMIAAALDAGIDAPWVTGDEAKWQDPGLRALLESRD